MSVLLVDKTTVSGENHQLSASYWHTLSDKVVSNTGRHAASARHTNLNDDMYDSYLRTYNTNQRTFTTVIIQVGRVRVMVFSATFNNISVIPWPSVLLVEETRRKPPTNCNSVTNYLLRWLWNTAIKCCCITFGFVRFPKKKKKKKNVIIFFFIYHVHEYTFPVFYFINTQDN